LRVSAKFAEERLQGVRAVVWELRLAVGELRGSNRMWTAKSSALIAEIEEHCHRLADLANAPGRCETGTEVR
jgi:hypothetical protein